MNDEETQEIILAWNQGKKRDFGIRETDGMLMQESRMYVSNNAELKKEILDEAHISAYAMHPGGTKMYHTIRPFYYWPGMKREIAKYPLHVPQWKWENITMDFVYKLPHAQNNYDGIWVIVDRLTKSADFIPVRENTAYHPQTDGQSERTIQILENMLRSSVLQFGDSWHDCLDLMKFAYNNSYHSSIGTAPFQAFYEKSCRTPLRWSEVGKRVLVGLEIVDETTQNVQGIKSNLKTAQDQQKSLTDKHATNRKYNVGDWVFLWLSPWKGVVRFGKKGKLSPRYIGPYMITERVGEVAYKLELPSDLSKVHDVLYVSMLRHYVSDPSHVIPPQPLEINPDLTYDEEPVTLLDWKDKELRNKTLRLVKVLWRNHSVQEATLGDRGSNERDVSTLVL
ncbi:unnamed protein product [Malus baccata var. baccata]